MEAAQQPRFRRADGTVDMDALEAHAGPELFATIVRRIGAINEAMAMPRVEPVQRRGRTQTQERQQEREHTS